MDAIRQFNVYVLFCVTKADEKSIVEPTPIGVFTDVKYAHEVGRQFRENCKLHGKDVTVLCKATTLDTDRMLI